MDRCQAVILGNVYKCYMYISVCKLVEAYRIGLDWLFRFPPLISL